MKIAVEDITAVKKTLRIEVPQDVVSQAFDHVYADLKRKVKLPGFRQGKVPLSLLESRFSHEAEHDVVKRLVPDYYRRALKEKGITPVILPTIEKVHVKRNEPLSFTATVETKPEFVLSEYDGLPLERKKIAITDSAVDEALKTLQDSHGQLTACEDSHAIQKNDFAIIDFVGQIEGQPFEGGEGKGMLVQVGSNTFLPGLEEQLIGKKKGEAAEAKFQFPADHPQKALAGKEALFHIVVKEVKTKSLPLLDDEFAKDVGEYDSLDALKTALKKGLEERAQREVESDIRNQAIQKLIEKNPMEVPPSLIEHEFSTMLFRLEQQIKQQGQPFDPSDPQWGPVREKYLNLARERVHGRLVLQEIARKESLTISNRDIETELAKMAHETNHDIEQIRNYITSNEGAMEDLRNRLLEDKALSLVLSKTIDTEPNST